MLQSESIVDNLPYALRLARAARACGSQVKSRLLTRRQIVSVSDLSMLQSVTDRIGTHRLGWARILGQCCIKELSVHRKPVSNSRAASRSLNPCLVTQLDSPRERGESRGTVAFR
jgi:hypothetical protein